MFTKFIYYWYYRGCAKYRGAQFKRAFFVLLPQECPDLEFNDIGDFEALVVSKDTESGDDKCEQGVNSQPTSEDVRQPDNCAADVKIDVDSVDPGPQPVSCKYVHTDILRVS